MKLEKIKSKHFQITLPSGGPTYEDTEPNFFKLPICMLCVARPRSGKTCAVSHLLKMLKRNKCLDRCLLVSGTFHNNAHYFDGIPLDAEEDVLQPSKDIPKMVEEIMNDEAQQYEDHLAKCKRYKKLLKMLKKDSPMFSIPDDLLYEFENLEPPEWKYEHKKKPQITIVFDDCEGTDLMKASSKLANLVIKFRHLGKFKSMPGALGCNIIFCTQNYKSQSGGLLKGIRNCISQICVWKTKNVKELEQIADECAGEVSAEEFMHCYESSIQERHDFMCIDFNKKPHHPSIFRRNFNEFIVPC